MQINKPIVAIIILIIISALAFFFAWPAYGEFKGMKVKLAVKQAEYDGESAYFAKVAEIIKGIEDRRDVLDKVDGSLPSEATVAPILYYFQKEGAQTGLLVKSITYANSVPTNTAQSKTEAVVVEKKVKDITFSIDLVGNYQGLKNFLFSLENSSRVFEVESLSLIPAQSLQSQSRDREELQTYNFRMQIKTHTY